MRLTKIRLNFEKKIVGRTLTCNRAGEVTKGTDLTNMVHVANCWILWRVAPSVKALPVVTPNAEQERESQLLRSKFGIVVLFLLRFAWLLLLLLFCLVLSPSNCFFFLLSIPPLYCPLPQIFHCASFYACTDVGKGIPSFTPGNTPRKGIHDQCSVKKISTNQGEVIRAGHLRL